jgi:alpha-tubulin suppressor-like RCC1 family protein
LGNGQTDPSAVPVTVQGLGPAVAVTVGRRHTCAATTNGTVWCWGENADGQLGDGSFVDSLVPVAVDGL